MSVESITWALRRRGITPTQKLVLLGIANHDGDGGAWPSVATLAAYAECSTRQVQRAVADLIGLGLVSRDIGLGGTAKTKDHERPNLYTLHRGGDTQVTPGGDTQVTPPVTPRSPEPSYNRPVEPEEPPYPPQAGEATGVGAIAIGAIGGIAWATAAAQADAEAFERFWKLYPRRIGKPKARLAWNGAKKRGADCETIITGLQTWNAYWDTRNEPQFVPHPSTWLNRDGFNDDPPPLPQTKLKTNPGVDILRKIREAEGR